MVMILIGPMYSQKQRCLQINSLTNLDGALKDDISCQFLERKTFSSYFFNHEQLEYLLKCIFEHLFSFSCII